MHLFIKEKYFTKEAYVSIWNPISEVKKNSSFLLSEVQNENEQQQFSYLNMVSIGS